MKTSDKKLFIFLSLVFFTVMMTAQNDSEFQELQSIRRIFQLSDYNDQVARLDSLIFMDDLEHIRSMADDDIHRGKAFLLLSSGLAPNINSTDIIFENKYDVYYYDYGCVSPSSAIIEAYNAVIFCHLTNRYGNDWLTEIRTDVSCIQSWVIRE
jgi:hypothetical protein